MIALLAMVSQGLPQHRKDMPSEISEYHKYKDSIYNIDGVLMCGNRILIPPMLRKEVLKCLHSAHHGVEGMENHARSRVVWPGITNDTEQTRARCTTCNRNAPSNPRHPPEEPTIPSMPFESICSDYFQLEGYHYLVTVDRLSGWCEVYRAKVDTVSSGSRGLVNAMRQLFATFGVPREVSSDGESVFTASETRDFFDHWGVKYRSSSAYHLISTWRAELGVKSMKRLLHDNIGPGGSLDNDKFLRALLTHRNNPDPLSKKSPAEVLFGHKLRDALPVFQDEDIYSNRRVLPVWREGWMLKEQAMRARAAKNIETLSEHCKTLTPLRHGDTVFIQNQSGNHPTKWDRTGVVTECHPHHKYTVKIDATGRTTTRNRQFLRRYTPPEKSVLLGVPPPHEVSVDTSPKHVTPPSNDTIPADLYHKTNDITHQTVPPTLPAATSVPQIHDVSHPVAGDTMPELRRSTRVKKGVQVYDASSGEYVTPQS